MRNRSKAGEKFTEMEMVAKEVTGVADNYLESY